MGSGGSEAVGAAFRVGQRSDLFQFWIDNTFADQLRNTVAALHLERFGTVVEQDDAHVATVVLVNDASAHIDEMLGSQAGTRSYTSVASGRHLDLQIGQGNKLASGGNRVVVCAKTVKCMLYYGVVITMNCLGEHLVSRCGKKALKNSDAKPG